MQVSLNVIFLKFLRNNIIVSFFIFNTGFSQILPNDFYELKFVELDYYKGQNWEKNSIIRNLRFKDVMSLELVEKPYFIRLGTNFIDNNLMIESYGKYCFNKNFYSYFHFKLTQNPNYDVSFSGLEQKRGRFGFYAGEMDLSGIGYENNIFLIEISRGKENLTAGDDLDLFIGRNSPSYDYFNFEIFKNKNRLKFFHGSLNSTGENINRYLVGKAYEFNNSSDFIFSISELIIYSGLNRSIDLAYLNPISSHLEIELNDRQNMLGGHNANAIWALNIDKFFFKTLRTSLNYFIDELILDKIQKEEGKTNSYGLSFKISNYFNIIGYQFIPYFSHSRISTYALRHRNYANNFIQRGIPLGSSIGSDGTNTEIGLKIFKSNKYILNLKYFTTKLGENSLALNPYKGNVTYLSSGFPSGEVIKQKALMLGLEYSMIKNLYVSLMIKNEIESRKIKINFGINYYYDIFKSQIK